MTPNIRKLINKQSAQYDAIIADLKQLEASHALNNAATASLSLNDLEELSMMVTRTKCLAMKLSLAHNRSEVTAMEDKNYSIRLQRFSQTLQEIHDYYGKRRAP